MKQTKSREMVSNAKHMRVVDDLLEGHGLCQREVVGDGQSGAETHTGPPVVQPCLQPGHWGCGLWGKMMLCVNSDANDAVDCIALIADQLRVHFHITFRSD